MPTDVIMPQMGESIFEGTITKWLKKPGDKVQRDEPLFEISTDKVDAEIPAPASGVLQEIKVAEGNTVQVNTVVGTIAADGEGAAAPAPASCRSCCQPRPRPSRKKPLRRPAACPPHRIRQNRTHDERRPFVAAGPQARARKQRRSRTGHRHRPRRPHHQARHHGLRRERPSRSAAIAPGRHRQRSRSSSVLPGSAPRAGCHSRRPRSDDARCARSSRSA